MRRQSWVKALENLVESLIRQMPLFSLLGSFEDERSGEVIPSREYVVVGLAAHVV